MNEHKKYLTERVPELLAQLTNEHKGAFGIMTPHHMVEHLIWVTKSSVKDMGPAPAELTDKQLGFMKFIEKGAHFKHRPSDKKQEDLDPPRSADLATAIAGIPEAVQRLYACPEDRTFYNPMMGKLSFAQMEKFHAGHYKYHLEEQFGLGGVEA